jgi:hypothetical protein
MAPSPSLPAWVQTSEGPAILYLGSSRLSGGHVAYHYSVAAAASVAVVTTPGPGMPGPHDTEVADLVWKLYTGET